ncbi:MAG TPA: hypothetical protein DDY31_10160 [Lachnospiraceae bacterium]|nr:hypothetical protein [Lachnospiraceae bacterium]
MEMENVVMQAENVHSPVYPTYKDRVFRMLFQKKKRLLELYNALNDSDYTNEEDLTVNTLENVIYMKMKNDISLILGCDMCLYEHQSSYCPNMPLRGFLYFADLYKKYLGDTELSTNRRIKIPVPRYIVFYNGLERKEEEFTQYLSESFLGEGGCIEVTVKTININYGHNGDLLEKSPTLNGYARFVSIIRKNLESMSLPQAVENAVTECIHKNILRDFLMEQRNEVVAMSIYEYNEEYAMRVTYEDGEIAGYQKGKAEGFRQNLVHNIEAAMKNFGISLEKACAGLDVTVEEYQRAKAQMIQTD